MKLAESMGAMLCAELNTKENQRNCNTYSEQTHSQISNVVTGQCWEAISQDSTSHYVTLVLKMSAPVSDRASMQWDKCNMK